VESGGARMIRFAAVAGLLASIVAACAKSNAVERTAPAPTTAAVTTARRIDDSVDVDLIIDALRKLPGEFRFFDPEQTGYVFTGGDALFREIAALDSAAVPTLVECLGNAEPAAATLEGRPVSLAVLCFRALTWTRWFETRRRSRSLPLGPGGVGGVRLRSTPEELIRARNWWRAYLAAGAPLGRP
jgi:hypothetical protein